jgi:hypothetical protein
MNNKQLAFRSSFILTAFAFILPILLILFLALLLNLASCLPISFDG